MRVKRGPLHTKKRRKILRQTKGFFHRRKSHLREARQALLKAGQYAYRDRRKKKAVFRALWHVQLNAALRQVGRDPGMHSSLSYPGSHAGPPSRMGGSYSRFMHALHTTGVALNRKMLALLARDHPAVFREVARKVLASPPGSHAGPPSRVGGSH